MTILTVQKAQCYLRQTNFRRDFHFTPASTGRQHPAPPRVSVQMDGAPAVLARLCSRSGAHTLEGSPYQAAHGISCAGLVHILQVKSSKAWAGCQSQLWIPRIKLCRGTNFRSQPKTVRQLPERPGRQALSLDPERPVSPQRTISEWR